MMAVQDFQEEIKATRAQPTQKGVSIATRIKREVEQEEAGMRVWIQLFNLHAPSATKLCDI